MDTPLDELDLASLRAERDGLRAREGALSYRRRLLQGQLDILRAEGVEGGDDLTAVLTEDGPSVDVRTVRAVDLDAPDEVEVPGLPDLEALDAAQRAELEQQLAAQEELVSAERREVLARLDVLQEELVRRYRDDGVDVADLVGGM